jgi:hypothetical protein
LRHALFGERRKLESCVWCRNHGRILSYS